MIINNDYTILLTNIIKEQELNCEVIDLPVIINCGDINYIGGYIYNENEDYLCIIIPTPEGREHAKIINKTYIISIEILYHDMLDEIEKKQKKIKGYD